MRGIHKAALGHGQVASGHMITVQEAHTALVHPFPDASVAQLMLTIHALELQQALSLPVDPSLASKLWAFLGGRIAKEGATAEPDLLGVRAFDLRTTVVSTTYEHMKQSNGKQDIQHCLRSLSNR